MSSFVCNEDWLGSFQDLQTRQLNWRRTTPYKQRHNEEDEKQTEQHLCDACGCSCDAAEAEDSCNECDDEKCDSPR